MLILATVAAAVYVGAAVLINRWNLFAAPMAVVAAGLTLAGAWWWERPRRLWDHRRVLGHCVRCGYDLTGNVGGVCPECGSAKA